MKQVAASVIAIGLLLWFAGSVSAAGARGRPGGGPKTSRPAAVVAPGLPVLPGRHPQALPGYFSYPYHYSYYQPPYYYYHSPVVIVAPSYRYPYYYSYYMPTTVFLSYPFYCFTHYQGFVSRIGFIDHVGGIHKIPLDTIASLCADGSESCVIE
jgi:hypothetical protein